MLLNIIFAFSGIVIVSLIASKIWEDKQKSKPILLRLVSLGDERVRHLSHEFAHRYAEWKERSHFFVSKQLPLHTKNIYNKTSSSLKERVVKYVGDIRGSRLLKKSDGISEFLKNISEKERGGRIDSEFHKEGSQEGEGEVK